MLPKGVAHMGRNALILALLTGLSGCGGSGSVNTDTNVDGVDITSPSSDWVMVWNDEFDGTAINSRKWTYEVNCEGGGNGEKQCYTDSDENAFVSDGTLKIVALPAEEGADLPYTSARMVTQYQGDWKYGRFEARMKLPEGQGSWPAFWMMPTDSVYGGWPRSGEIDIVEAVNLKVADEDGNVESDIHGTLHYGKAWPDNDSSGQSYTFPQDQNPADDFHTYAVEWQEGEIRWYVDDYLYATQQRSVRRFNSDGEVTGLKHRGWFAEYFDQVSGELTTYWEPAPFDQNFFLILNLAVGGDWPENVNQLGIDAEAFALGQTLEVDYVRVYQCATGTSDGSGCETVRSGYLDEDDALVIGKAPVPVTGVPDLVVLYDDKLADNLSFGSYDPNDMVTYEEVAVDGRGTVIELDKTGPDGNFYINASTPFDLTAYSDKAELVFDMKVESFDAGVELLVKFDTEWPNVSDVSIVPTPIGEWTEVRINIQALLADDNSLSPGNFADPGLINNILVLDPLGAFKAQFDNIRLLSGASEEQIINLYDDSLASGLAFNFYDNNTNSITYSEVEEDGRGNVIEVVKAGATGNFYLQATDAYDISSYNTDAELVFDMNVTSMDAGTQLLIKLDSGWPNVSDVFVDIPALGEWVEVRLNIQELLADQNEYAPGSFADSTNIVNVFVMEPTAPMTIKFDNIRYHVPARDVLYGDAVNGDIVINSYNPDGFISSAEVAEDGRGNVIEVIKTGATGNWYLDSSAAPFDISDYGVNSELVFDMYVTSVDAGVDLYIKLDSGWPNVSDVLIDIPATGEWTEVKLNLQTLLADENYIQSGFADSTNIVNPFVMEPTGAMSVKFDNIRFVKR